MMRYFLTLKVETAGEEEEEAEDDNFNICKFSVYMRKVGNMSCTGQSRTIVGYVRVREGGEREREIERVDSGEMQEICLLISMLGFTRNIKFQCVRTATAATINASATPLTVW